ncbi:MAG: phosphohistidine phosphatase SixA [Planctomycetota bacterium]
MWIHLLRHGRAEEGFGKPDEQRALTPEGWQKLRASAPTWRRLVVPLQVAFVSPLRRAQETASVLLENVGGDPEVRIDGSLAPHGDAAETLARLLDERRTGTESVAAVGHEPHLGTLLGLLLTGRPSHAIPFKKGMLVAVELRSTASAIAELRWSLTQRAAAELA